MTFEEIERKLEKLFLTYKELPHVENDMIPFGRRSRAMEAQSNPNPKLSAVIFLIYPEDGKAKTALILRGTYNGTHSAQIGLPGGKKDPTDVDLEETALRELNEEIGVDGDEVKILGALSEVYIPPSGFLVKPYVGIMDRKPTFRLDPREVEELIEVEIEHLFDEDRVQIGPVEVNNGAMKIKAPYFDVFGHKVWGATAVMLFELKHYVLNLGLD